MEDSYDNMFHVGYEGENEYEIYISAKSSTINNHFTYPRKHTLMKQKYPQRYVRTSTILR